MKLRKLVKENEEAQAQKLTREQKKDIIAAVSKFNEYGKSVYRESDIRELVETLQELSNNASQLAVNEAGDWNSKENLPRVFNIAISYQIVSKKPPSGPSEGGKFYRTPTTSFWNK